MTKKIIPTKNQSVKICSIEGCGQKHKGRGFCAKHYQRFKKHDSALYLKGSHEPIVDKFWEYVVKKDNECWEWVGGLTNKGYGKTFIEGRQVYAHIASWTLAYGTSPLMSLLHSCDNRKCVNPRHLREGTAKENAQDMVQRGRSLFGEKNPSAKLTEQQVLEIVELIDSGKPIKAIARIYFVSDRTVSFIRDGVKWGYLTGR